MAELIDKTAAYNALKHEAETHGLSFSAEAYDRAARIIDQMPTIKPEVRHGRWIPNGKRSVLGDLEYICSECSRKITVNWAVKDPSEYNAFCSGCGAQMDGGADNG